MKRGISLRGILSLLLLFTFIVSGCGGGKAKPSGLIERSQSPAPGWINIPTKREGKNYLVVGLGRAATKGEAQLKALNEAKAMLAGLVEEQITSQMKNEFEADKEKVLRDDLTKQIKVFSQAKLKDVVADQYYYEVYRNPDGSKRYEYYILVKYPISKIEEERERIAKELAKRLAKVDDYVKAAEQDLAKGYVVGAIKNYIQAAINSTRIEERKEEFYEYTKRIKDIVARLKFEVENDKQKIDIDKGSEEPFVVKLYYKPKGGSYFPVKDATVSFKLEGGGSYDKSAVTDSEGRAECNIRRMKKVGKRVRLKAYLNLKDLLTPFSDPKLDSKYRAEGLVLEDLIKDTKVEFTIEAMSKSRSLPMGVYSLERMENGKVLRSEALSSIKDILANNGFKIRSGGINTKRLADMSNDEIADYFVKKLKRRGIKRVAFANIEVFDRGKRGGYYKFHAKGNVVVIDIDSGDIIAAKKLRASGAAKNKKMAISYALKELGKKMGKYIVKKL